MLLPLTLFTVTTTCIEDITQKISSSNNCEISSPNDFKYSDFIFTLIDNSQTVSVKCPLAAIEGNSSIPSIVLKSDPMTGSNQRFTVVEIQSKCFENQKGLTSISLPDTLTQLGKFSFKGCTSLSWIKLPDKVLSIPNYCFFECYTLESITVSQNLTSIDNYAFYQCRMLRYFAFPPQLETLGVYAFSNCHCAFHDLHLPDNVDTIPAHAFEYCISVQTIRLHKNIKYIKEHAFSSCTQLTHILFDDSESPSDSNLEFIGSKAFEYTSIQNFLSVPFELSRIDEGCFMHCNNLLNVNLTCQLDAISSNCFLNCTKLQSIVLPPNLTSIGNSAFKHCASISKINLPDALCEIGDFAWMQCTSLTQINLPANLAKIGQSSFALCAKLLIPAQFPEQLVSIGAFAFANCLIRIKKIILPPTLTKIGNNPFKMAAIEEITMNENGTYIQTNQSVIYSCTGTDKKVVGFAIYSPLTSIEILEGTTRIGIDAFYNAISLQNITFPKSLISIDAEAFESALSLQKLVLPNQLKTIGGDAFKFCLNLNGIVEIPSTVNSIGVCAFCCTGIERFWVHPSNPFFFTSSGCLYSRQFTLIQSPNGFKNQTDFEIPDGTIKVGHSSFKHNDHIVSIQFSDTISEIEDEAFMSMPNLQRIVLNDNLKVIGALAFSSLLKLEEITFPASLTHLNNMAFYMTPLHSIVFNDCNLVQADSDVFDLSKISCIKIPFTCNETITWSIFPPELINTPDCFATNLPTTTSASDSTTTSLNFAMYIFIGIMILFCVTIIVVVSFMQYRKRAKVMKDPNILESYVIPNSAPIDYYTTTKNHERK